MPADDSKFNVEFNLGPTLGHKSDKFFGGELGWRLTKDLDIYVEAMHMGNVGTSDLDARATTIANALGVSIDEDEAALRKFVAARGVTFPILRDPGGRIAAGAYRTTGWPETFVIDAAGVLKEQYVGPSEWDTPEAIEHFRQLLN
jgi:hypothetical protein